MGYAHQHQNTSTKKKFIILTPLDTKKNNFVWKYLDGGVQKATRDRNSSQFDNPSLSTRAIETIENTTIQLDKSR